MGEREAFVSVCSRSICALIVESSMRLDYGAVPASSKKTRSTVSRESGRSQIHGRGVAHRRLSASDAYTLEPDPDRTENPNTTSRIDKKPAYIDTKIDSSLLLRLIFFDQWHFLAFPENI